MSFRQATSLLLAFTTGVLTPVVCVPDALAPPGHGWHLVVDEGAAHAHYRGHEAGDGHQASASTAAEPTMAAGTALGSPTWILGTVPGAQGGARSAGVPDVAAPPSTTNSDPTLSMTPGPAVGSGVEPPILSEDLSPPPRASTGFSA